MSGGGKCFVKKNIEKCVEITESQAMSCHVKQCSSFTMPLSRKRAHLW